MKRKINKLQIANIPKCNNNKKKALELNIEKLLLIFIYFVCCLN